VIEAIGDIQHIAGQPDIWARKWRDSEGTADECLFTRGRPSSAKEMQQQRHFLRLWDESLSLIEQPRFLEIGAGRCTTACYLRSFGADVTCLDCESDGFRLARKNCNRFGLPAPRFVLADADRSGLPDGGFGVVYSIGLLEHFSDPESVLREFCRVTADGGLNWHVIVNGKSGEVYRNNYAAASWVQWMRMQGQAASCEVYGDAGENVLLLKWRQR